MNGHGDEIAQVDAVLVAEGGELHADEGCERDETELFGAGNDTDLDVDTIGLVNHRL